jgi:hypothetical protein
MNYFQQFTGNTSTAILASIFGGLGSYSFFESGLYEIPFIDYDIPTFLIYGAMVGASSFLLKNSGDFILPLISNNTQFNNLSKLTIPLSVGLISVATLYVVNGFDIPTMNNVMKMILLSSGSYIVADWSYNKIMGNNSMMENNKPQVSLPIISNPINTPINTPINPPFQNGYWLF